MQAPKTETIARLVHAVRGERVLFDADLAVLYGVSTAALNQAVKRNQQRFPADFMFRLTADEWSAMRSQMAAASPPGAMMSQIVTSSRRKLVAPPYAFTEQGVAMLSSVLRSPCAVEVNIAIMRTFVGGVRRHQAPYRRRRHAAREPQAPHRFYRLTSARQLTGCHRQ